VAGELVYFTVPVPDADRGRAFYGELFGWRFEAGNVPGGFQIANAQPPGGLFGGGEGTSPSVWFGVDEIEAGVAKVRGLGGEAGEPEEIESGFMASCRDDQGTEFNLWAPKPSP
jgi:predicted enzyme related to lactoylglutathione lyase